MDAGGDASRGLPPANRARRGAGRRNFPDHPSVILIGEDRSADAVAAAQFLSTSPPTPTCGKEWTK